VRVALYTGAGVASSKTASVGRGGSSDPCYNGRDFNDLGTVAARAKMGHFSHRHSMGNKVKFIAPVSLWSLVGTADTNATGKMASNI
jgi:hypothetical protein